MSRCSSNHGKPRKKAKGPSKFDANERQKRVSWGWERTLKRGRERSANEEDNNDLDVSAEKGLEIISAVKQQGTQEAERDRHSWTHFNRKGES